MAALAHHARYGAAWYAGALIDPFEMEKLRRRQKMYLARYARQDVFAWEGREVVELDRHFEELAAMMEEENGVQRAQEDR